MSCWKLGQLKIFTANKVHKMSNRLEEGFRNICHTNCILNYRLNRDSKLDTGFQKKKAVLARHPEASAKTRLLGILFEDHIKYLTWMWTLKSQPLAHYWLESLQWNGCGICSIINKSVWEDVHHFSSHWWQVRCRCCTRVQAWPVLLMDQNCAFRGGRFGRDNKWKTQTCASLGGNQQRQSETQRLQY